MQAALRRFHLAAHMAARLYPYQREGVLWLWGLHCGRRGGILADDMGLGKTLQVCAFLSGLLAGGAITRALVVAPSSLLHAWRRELLACKLPSSRVLLYHGSSQAERATALRCVAAKGGVLLTTYGMVSHNAGELGACTETWDWTVCDEGHKLKNSKMKLARAFCAIVSALAASPSLSPSR